MATYTFSDLQSRYGLQKSALHKFLTRHIDEINHNGQHALKTQNKWVFDDLAISIIDRMRNYGQASLGDAQTIQELNDTVTNLQQQLLLAQKMNIKQQQEISQLKDQLITGLKETAEVKDKLATASFELLRIQVSEKDNVELRDENKRLTDNLISEKKKSSQLQKQLINMGLQAKKTYDENLDLKECINKSNKNSQQTAWSRRKRPIRIKLVKI